MNIEKKRWISLAMQVIIGSVTGFVYVLTVFIGPLNEKFGWSIATILMAFTIANWAGTPGNIIGGILRDKFGSKKCIVVAGIVYGLAIIASGFVTNVWLFIICQGVIAALCMFIIYVSALANIGTLFPDKRGLSMGIYMAGTSFGAAIMAPIAEALIRTHSVAFSLVVEGIIYGALVVVCGLLVTEAPEGFKPKNWKGDTEEKLAAHVESGPQVKWSRMIRMPVYYLLIIALVSLSIMPMFIMSNGSMLAQDVAGATAQQAAWIVSMITIMMGVGGFVFGAVTDKLKATATLLVIAAVEGIAAIIVLVTGASNMVLFVIVAAMLGLMNGGVGAIVPVLTMNVFGEKYFGVNMGVISIQALIASFIGPQVAARMAIRPAFILGIILAVLAFLLMLLIQKMIKRFCETWVNDPEDETLEAKASAK